MSLVFRAVTVLAVACLLGCQTLPSDSQIRADADTVSGRSIVVLVDTDDSAANLRRKAVRRGYGLIDVRKLPNLGTQMLTFRPPKGLSGARAITELEGLEPSATAGVNHRYRVQGKALASNVPDRSRAYAHQLVEWPENGCIAPVLIGVVDGFHAVSSAAQKRAVFADFAPTPPPEEAVAHGDAIRSILTDESYLKGARLALANVMDAENGASVDVITSAFDWLVGRRVDVVSVSLAGPYNKILDKALNRVLSRGVHVVAAVGNDGPGAYPRYPAAHDGVVAVTAVDAQAKIYPKAVRGDHVDVAAPGVDVAVRTLDGDWRYVSGTSIGAPFVSAAIAARRASSKEGSSSIIARLTDEAVDLGDAGRDPIFGAGLIRLGHSCP